MDQAPPPTGIRHFLGDHQQDLLAQLSQPQAYPEEHSALRFFHCEQSVGSYLQYFYTLPLTPRPEEAPSPSHENVAHTLGSMSAVARLCGTPNESRVALFDW